jgi:hypothetical protein
MKEKGRRESPVLKRKFYVSKRTAMMAHKEQEAGRHEFLESTKAGYTLTVTVTVNFTRT